ncbi:putative endonuclease related to Holliday junction resolvase [Galbibacter orientalis DSM 19592]|uniref:UPF0102 protein JoomaDRAFT_0938 n=1 Tax=Galbibacter orientalis DSM 19592 TaxID=926559 RepID=I3C2W8_9FLAO|nr:YraN family protein [Galbibacter orientalis]EIJ37961.1 putative endonuclease related to Holliday junction resolvase [Galbibacter orientalis DSM 19592]|tara:strand:+ start:176 stop:535 length:360 start_codon:yes stop_codon:yes gene_type:complete
MAVHNVFGQKAEEMAVALLFKKGYTILERNYRYNFAEVDVIAEINNQIICVEVKARSSIFYGDPQSFVIPKKIKLLVKVMNHYIIENGIDKEVRFDIIAVFKNKGIYDIKHFEDAFYYF